MKKGASLLFAIIVFFMLVPAAHAAQPLVVVNGQVLEGDQPPLMKNYRTLVPLRAAAEALGAEVSWEAGTITIEKDGGVIQLRVNNTRAVVNGGNVTLDVPAEVTKNNRTVIPLRFVSEHLGADVTWDSRKRVASITDERDRSGLIEEIYEKGELFEDIILYAFTHNLPIHAVSDDLEKYATPSYIYSEGQRLLSDHTLCYECDSRYFPWHISPELEMSIEPIAPTLMELRTFIRGTAMEDSTAAVYTVEQINGEWLIDSYRQGPARLSRPMTANEAAYMLKKEELVPDDAILHHSHTYPHISGPSYDWTSRDPHHYFFVESRIGNRNMYINVFDGTINGGI
ncbi:copper amine oxidase N-terminal domain-containing protein [Alkalicoccus urumqiensis]|uniref:Copper amine oxidase-like N-terminal domain-containing protein n=1 Tax=Alkalicoccus urumqiensis TaxID=1548213 RepID=A0A2P6MHX5_ALKUR|nr:copper amine oxidase N-terminal domain-containing protein [Alkalicoccus urumqiensis]PRO65877.1 hypothetical protein C6I21_08250 [Alkalicoccus urumqiensis]